MGDIGPRRRPGDRPTRGRGRRGPRERPRRDPHQGGIILIDLLDLLWLGVGAIVGWHAGRYLLEARYLTSRLEDDDARVELFEPSQPVDLVSWSAPDLNRSIDEAHEAPPDEDDPMRTGLEEGSP